MEGVVLPVVPVDVVKAVAAGGAVDGLGEAGAEQEEIVNGLVGGAEAVFGGGDFEAANGLVEVALGVGVLFAFSSDAVGGVEPLAQDGF